jgi:hypothetical protein
MRMLAINYYKALVSSKLNTQQACSPANDFIYFWTFELILGLRLMLANFFYSHIMIKLVHTHSMGTGGGI